MRREEEEIKEKSLLRYAMEGQIKRHPFDTS